MKREDIIKKMGQAIFELDLTAGDDEKAEAALDAFLGELEESNTKKGSLKNYRKHAMIRDGQLYQKILDLNKDTAR